MTWCFHKRRMTVRNFHLVSLGCAKNLVDSEVMISSLIDSGWGVVDDPYEADLLIVNTCGFIQPAVEEAIEELIGMQIPPAPNQPKCEDGKTGSAGQSKSSTGVSMSSM